MPLSKVQVTSSDGARVEVHLDGAHVTSWRPAPGEDERLFLSTRSRFGPGMSIRGGIPVIFPQFAAEGPLPRHGFARTTRWTLDDAHTEQGGDAVATLVLTDSDETRAIWPARFRAVLRVRATGQRLSVTLAVTNMGTAAFQFAAALHTYLRVHDVADAEVVGLRGTRYRESATPGRFTTDSDDVVHIRGEIDRVYIDAPPELVLREPHRALSIGTDGFPDVVLWNPGAKAAEMADMEPGGERFMLCVEAAAVQHPVRLEPGREWTGVQTLTAMTNPETTARKGS
ncbi:MAG: D-hexose-6-phosphate mutarotase [bacterium]